MFNQNKFNQNQMRNIIYVTILSVFCVVAQAQQAVTTSGNHTENSTAILSWTIGQAFTKTFGNSNHELTQGIHQVTLSVTALDEIQSEQIEISAFPNPTTHYVEIEVDCEDFNDLSYQLYDFNGKLLEQKQISNSITTIETTKLPTSTYFIKIYRSQTYLRTFQIIKK